MFGKIWQKSSFLALQIFSAFYYHFTDENSMYGIDKPVAMNRMIFILLLFHTDSAFPIVDTENQLTRAAQVTQLHHCPLLLLTYSLLIR